MKICSTLFFVLYITVAVIIAPQKAVSQNRITILRAGDWEPYHYIKDNALHGNLILLIRNASDISGIKVNFKTVPNWNRCLRLMKMGKVDAFFPLFKTKEREEYMTFHENGILDYEKDYFVALADKKIAFAGDLQVLKKYKIGVTKGYTYGAEFEAADYLQKIPSRDEQKLLDLLFAENRYDLIVGDRKVISSIASKTNILKQLHFI